MVCLELKILSYSLGRGGKEDFPVLIFNRLPQYTVSPTTAFLYQKSIAMKIHYESNNFLVKFKMVRETFILENE